MWARPAPAPALTPSRHHAAEYRGLLRHTAKRCSQTRYRVRTTIADVTIVAIANITRIAGGGVSTDAAAAATLAFSGGQAVLD